MTYIPNSILNKPKYLVTSHTSAQETSNSANTGTIILGSAITYEPEVNSSKVVYEISYYTQKLSGTTFHAVYLEQYVLGSWSEINDKYRKNFGNYGTNDGRWYIHYRFVLPSWTGSRDLRLNISHNQANYQSPHHAISHWDGSSDTTNYLKFCNTNLLVYSI